MKVQLDCGSSLDLGEISESQGKRVKSQKYLAKKKALLVKSIRLPGSISVKPASQMKGLWGVREEEELCPTLCCPVTKAREVQVKIHGGKPAAVLPPRKVVI